jgi:hypothetical protein
MTTGHYQSTPVWPSFTLSCTATIRVTLETPPASKLLPEVRLKKLTSLVFLCVLFLFYRDASAQELDAAFGVGTMNAPSPTANSNQASLNGGAYPAFSADFILKSRLGVGGELAWRGTQSVFQEIQPYRPLFYDFNGIYAPKLGKHLTAEMMGGIGWESIRLYQPFVTCGFTCTDFISSNHFLGHFGGGLRYYVWGHLFVRPEAHVYLVHNNVEFNSAHAVRYGMSIGYTFGGPGF